MSPLDAAIEAAARSATLLVASDMDGTLAPIVPRPEDARPDPRSVRALHALAGLSRTHACVLSGRSRGELVGLFGEGGPLRLIGSHGVETDEAGAPPLSAEEAGLREALRAELSAVAGRYPGCLVELKPVAVAFHYRMATEEDARAALVEVLAGPTAKQAVRALHGSKVLELSVVSVSKGRSLAALRDSLAASCAVFAGDDVTDEDAFAVLRPDDVGIKVGPGATRAVFRVENVADVVALLERVLVLRRRALGLGEG